eukprot:859640-Prymnesium_polylepis.1
MGGLAWAGESRVSSGGAVRNRGKSGSEARSGSLGRPGRPGVEVARGRRREVAHPVTRMWYWSVSRKAILAYPNPN